MFYEIYKKFNMLNIENINFKGKRALVRVDFNVPLDENNKVTDNTRILGALKTINYILDKGGSCILISHLGRPKEKNSKDSLLNVKSDLEILLKKSVVFIDDCVGLKVEEKCKKLNSGDVILLENLRFYDEETKGDEIFARDLSKLADIYINDAFGTAHRAHASTTTVAKYFSIKAPGFLLKKEILAIEKVIVKGEKPRLAILGGAKVSSKITIIENMLKSIDELIIAGGMSYTFIKALGGKIGDSIFENEYMDYSLKLINKIKKLEKKIILPVDVVCGNKFSNDADVKICEVNNIPDGWSGLDSGPKTLIKFKEAIISAKTILWNGPVGVFEMDLFSKGTIEVGNFVSEATDKGAFSLVGGGDSVAAVKKFNFEDKVSYVSTGGGAMLESLEGKVLPGIKALD